MPRQPQANATNAAPIANTIVTDATGLTTRTEAQVVALESTAKGAALHAVVGLSELSPYPPSDSSLSKHVAGDSGFRFSARDGEAHRSGAVRP
eukprot:CAMPEP_0183348012 /NCGR_PEP_ID=MMETSP0164_2-20130417/12667_1 /TAXON_ID=221442 /ORGANISM="Coccolithus pelagicus ssp braarudi, Strain PLY182g" /LENGTH=92 /DNA_ID=CAMNT_0025519547 /DNA_START=247 /DNA_END=525 /DNA_ORIENTATION=-